MAPRPRGNTALLEGENLTQEEQKIMDDNRNDSGQPEPTPSPPPAPTPEPQPTEQPKPEAPKDGDAPVPEPSQATPDGKQRTVDYGAFHEERERRREERARREKAEQELARLTSRFATLEELARAAAAEAQPKPQLPDVTTDPIAHFQAQLQQRDAKIAQFEAWQRDQQQMMQQQQAINMIRQRAVMAEQEFTNANPDYLEAADFVRNVRDNWLKRLGFNDPAQRAQQIAYEALSMAAGAEQNGTNIAQQIYDMAKDAGWVPKAKANGSAGTPAPAPAPAPAPDQAGIKKLETVARGQQANQTAIGKLSGQSAPTGAPELVDVANMNDDDFKAWADKYWLQTMRG